METIEEIDEFYEREIERIDREFFDELKKNKNKELVSKNYRLKLKSVREDYEKKFSKFLKNQKIQVEKEKQKILNFKKNKNDNEKSLNVVKIDFKDIEKKLEGKSKKDMFDFRLNLKIREIHNRIPGFLLVIYFKIKLSFKRFRGFIKKNISNLFAYLKQKIINLFNFIKESIIKIIGFIKKIIFLLPGLLAKLKPKKKEKEEEKKKDEEKKSLDEKPQ